MWALINSDNEIEEIIRFPRNITINDVRHSRRIFTAWSWTELNAIGIYTVELGSRGDDRFEMTSDPTYAFDSGNNKVTTSYTTTDKALADANAVDEDGNNITDADGNQVINYGLKTLAKNKAKEQANGFIKRFNWLVERSIYDSSKAIPDAVKTYVAAIRKDCSDIETAIDNASDMTAFKALYADTLDSEGEVTEVNRINRWTSESTVKDYLR